MKVGDTFLFGPSPTATKHLHIVLTNPDTDGCVLIVNVTSVYHDKDQMDSTVVLNRGEHRFLTKPRSYVFYRGAEIKKVTDLQGYEAAGLLVNDDACSKAVIDLARAGIGASPHCRRVIQEYYKKCKDL